MLGRLKHEGANASLTADGSAVVYMGDDERGDYIYKFVSRDPMTTGPGRVARRANLRLLDHGTLYVARLSGDGPADREYDGLGEWIALCTDTESYVPHMSVADVLVDTRLAAERINTTMQEPFDLPTQQVHVAASVGIARLDQHARTAEQLLRNADLAMYQAKTIRAGGYAVFHPQMHAGLVERVRLETDLRKALEDHQLLVHYQPMISLRTGQITGVEALLRWQHPERGLIPPSEFIPLAESTGLIRPIGLWVLREACQQTMRWNQLLPASPPLRVSVNVSPRQLEHGDLVGHVAQMLRDTGLPATRLTLEMTESVLMDNGDETLATLTALRELGVRLAIDDFGTGYSSLSYLHRFPIDVLKIDRSFVERLTNGGDSALVSTILRLGQSMRLETVAEGIEHAQEVLKLRRQGCTTGQGYHFSHPVAADQIADLLSEQIESLYTPDEQTPA